jgi:hypothetical protein
VICLVGQKPRVFFQFANSVQNVVDLKESPIQIFLLDSGLKCWRFSGQGKFNDFYFDMFGCGDNPGWFDNGVYLNPTLNGNLFLDSVYGTRYGTESIEKVTDDSERSGFIKIGNCLTCLNPCSLTIKNEQGITLFTVSGKCPCKFSVACGGRCPENFCECPILEYPGYCCLDCSATAASIRAITNELRSKNG